MMEIMVRALDMWLGGCVLLSILLLAYLGCYLLTHPHEFLRQKGEGGCDE